MRFEGKRLKVSVFGQSHGPAIGAVIEGLPAGIRVDEEALRALMRRRAPGQGSHTTARRETDEPRWLSGLKDGVTCGGPLTLMIENRDVHSADYAALQDVPRPSHADWPAFVKYGESHDVRGGGMFSARLTAPLCAAGGVALQCLAKKGVAVGAHIASIADVHDSAFDPVQVSRQDFAQILRHPLPVLDAAAGEQMLAVIEQARKAADSVGGVVECAALGLPVGLGGPLFEGLESSLASAIFAIPAVRGVAFGAGFAAAGMRGSAHNDPLGLREGKITPLTNHAGGVTGGLTTGLPLLFTAAFKPTPSIGQAQRSVSLSRGEETELVISGRHDPCVVPRAVPVVEAVTALVLLDRMMSETEVC